MWIAYQRNFAGRLVPFTMPERPPAKRVDGPTNYVGVQEVKPEHRDRPLRDLAYIYPVNPSAPE